MSATGTLRSRREPAPRRLPFAAPGLVFVGAAIVLAFFVARGEAAARAGSSPGLPTTRDYHSLLVSPTNTNDLILGTHDGLYMSTDGGRSWRFDALLRNDAMNLARSTGRVVWLAGHDVFKKSMDGGKSWTDVQPKGVPTLDLHAFTVDARNPQTLYAAIAGQGLYRSTDAGRSFKLVSRRVGGSVTALASFADGRLLAADVNRGLLESTDGGRTWKTRLAKVLMLGLAINPSNPRRVLATGAGIAISTDGGRSWLAALDLPRGSGPVAWSPSKPSVAYVVGFNRRLYRSDDGGVRWHVVPPRA